MVDGYKIGRAYTSLDASYDYYFGDKRMPHYEFKHVPDTPLWRVYLDGNYRQEFTSLAAAKAYVEHLEQHEDNSMDELGRGRDRDEWKHEAAAAMRLKR